MPFSTLSSTLRTVIDILDEVGDRQRSGVSGGLDLMDFDSIRAIAQAIAGHTSTDDLTAAAVGVGRAVEELEAFSAGSGGGADPIRTSLWRQTRTMLRTVAMALDNERHTTYRNGYTTEALPSAVATAIAERVTTESVERVRFTFDATLQDISAL